MRVSNLDIHDICIHRNTSCACRIAINILIFRTPWTQTRSHNFHQHNILTCSPIGSASAGERHWKVRHTGGHRAHVCWPTFSLFHHKFSKWWRQMKVRTLLSLLQLFATIVVVSKSTALLILVLEIFRVSSYVFSISYFSRINWVISIKKEFATLMWT